MRCPRLHGFCNQQAASMDTALFSRSPSARPDIVTVRPALEEFSHTDAWAGCMVASTTC
jgi:hypothetical protein